MSQLSNCIWCNEPFTPRKSGRRQRYCRRQHKNRHRAAKFAWAEREIIAQGITIDDLRKVLKENYNVPDR
jgi:hypothetical protein